MKRVIVACALSFLMGLAANSAMAAININIENIYLRDIAAIAFCAAQMSGPKGWFKGIEADSYIKADLLLSARGKK